MHGRSAPAGHGSSRRIARSLTGEELAALSERLRSEAEAFLYQIGAVDEDSEEGWVERQTDGSWAWRIGGGKP
jgi:hypothetical protein